MYDSTSGACMMPALNSSEYRIDVETYLLYARQTYTKYYYDTLIQSGNSPEVAAMQAHAAVEKLIGCGYFQQLRALFFQHQQGAMATTSGESLSNTVLPEQAKGKEEQRFSLNASSSGTVEQPKEEGATTVMATTAENSNKGQDGPSSVKKLKGPVTFKLKLNSSKWKNIEQQVEDNVSRCCSSSVSTSDSIETVSSSAVNNVVGGIDNSESTIAMKNNLNNVFSPFNQSSSAANDATSAANENNASFCNNNLPVYQMQSGWFDGGRGKRVSYDSNVNRPPPPPPPGPPPGLPAGLPPSGKNSNSGMTSSKSVSNAMHDASNVQQNNINNIWGTAQSSQYSNNYASQYNNTRQTQSEKNLVQLSTAEENMNNKIKRNRFDMKTKEVKEVTNNQQNIYEDAGGVSASKTDEKNCSSSGPTSEKPLDEQNLKHFYTWIKRVYDELEPLHDTVAWRRALNQYTNRIVEKFRVKQFSLKNWEIEPLPTEAEVIKENEEDKSVDKHIEKTNNVEESAEDIDEEESKSAYGNTNGRYFNKTQQNDANQKSKTVFRSFTNKFNRAGRGRKDTGRRKRGGGTVQTSRSFIHNTDGDEKNDDNYDDNDNDNEDENYIPLVSKNNSSRNNKKNNAQRKKQNYQKRLKFEVPVMSLEEEESKRELRMHRFSQQNSNDNNSSENAVVQLTPSLTWQEKLAIAKSTQRIVGTSRAYEKQFLRLCGPPDPSTIRPEEILKESFKMVVEKYNKDKNWRYSEEQFRSIRQDLTVQGIKNDLTIKVYETNARFALENADLGQFNQCQTQLKELYKALDSLSLREASQTEFLCYRLLYLSMQNMRLDLLRVVGELNEEEKNQPAIIFSMQIRRAVAEGNWRKYFRLKKQGPYLSEYLLDIFQSKMRMQALLIMAKTSRQLDPKLLTNELCFSSLAECMSFLESQQTVWNVNKLVDCKASIGKYAISPLLQSRKVKALG